MVERKGNDGQVQIVRRCLLRDTGARARALFGKQGVAVTRLYLGSTPTRSPSVIVIAPVAASKPTVAPNASAENRSGT